MSTRQTVLLAIFLAWSNIIFAVANPQSILALRQTSPEAWTVEVKDVERTGDINAMAHSLKVQLILKSVERTKTLATQGEEVCLRYSVFNKDFKGQVPIGLQYPSPMQVGSPYKVWLQAKNYNHLQSILRPNQAPKKLTKDECYEIAAESASIEVIKKE